MFVYLFAHNSPSDRLGCRLERWREALMPWRLTVCAPKRMERNRAEPDPMSLSPLLYHYCQFSVLKANE